MKRLQKANIPMVLSLLRLVEGAEDIEIEPLDSKRLRLSISYPFRLPFARYPGINSIRYLGNYSYLVCELEPDSSLYRDIRCLIEGVQ